jgi:hypothetical protein
MDTFLSLTGGGLMIFFTVTGAALAYRIITSDRPVISQTNIRTTHIHRTEKEETK